MTCGKLPAEMPELPSGTVTFLFTDVEGSTSLLRELGSEYGEVLAEHQRVLRAAFSERGGFEVDTQGDAFFVAFAHPGDALLAAYEGQRALAAREWPGGVQVKVRIGIHSGQAELADGRYVGLPCTARRGSRRLPTAGRCSSHKRRGSWSPMRSWRMCRFAMSASSG